MIRFSRTLEILSASIAVLGLSMPCLATPGASFREGLRAFHAGRFADAINPLRAVTGDAVAPLMAGDAQLLLGLSLLETGAHEEAATVLEGALGGGKERGSHVLADHVHMALGRALTGSGRHKEASAHFLAVTRDQDTSLRVDAAFLHAMSLRAAGADAQARAALSRFVVTMPDAPQAMDAQVTLAELEYARGRATRAVTLLREVLRRAPGGHAGHRAAQSLAAMASDGVRAAGEPTPGEALLNLEWLVSERRFDEALPGLERYRTEARRRGDREGRLRAAELVARALRESGRTQEALDTHLWLKRHGRTGAGPRTLAAMYARLGRWKEAEQQLLRLRSGRKSAQYWQDVGKLHMSHGRYEQAEVGFLRAVRKRRRKATPTLRRQLAWCAFRRGRTKRALDLFTEVGAKERSRRVWASYWKARTLQEGGLLDEALAGFDAIVEREPLGFYGILSWSRAAEIRGEAPPTAPQERGVSGDDGAAGQEAQVVAEDGPAQGGLQWEPAMWRIDPTWEPAVPDGATRSTALEEFQETWGDIVPEAKRAVAFSRLGMIVEARDELRIVLQDIRALRRGGYGALVKRARSDLLDNRRTKRARGGAHIRHQGRRDRVAARKFATAVRRGGLQSDLARTRVALGDPHAVRKSAIRGGALRKPLREEHLTEWRLAYPIVWVREMASATSAHRVPPAFLYAIMMVESAFHPRAVSVAHAYGLVQMIPRTGRRVAAELDFGEFAPELLLTPDTSTYLGGHYMGRLLTKFQGQEPLAAAAYNCGPHRVAAWLDANPDRTLDVFMEEIPYGQTWRYTRSSLVHTARYRRLYYGDQSMYVTNELLAEPLPVPNY